jgi:hypothetical protein
MTVMGPWGRPIPVADIAVKAGLRGADSPPASMGYQVGPMMAKELLCVPSNGAIQVLFEASLRSQGRARIVLAQQEEMPSIKHNREEQKAEDEVRPAGHGAAVRTLTSSLSGAL